MAIKINLRQTKSGQFIALLYF